MHDQFKDYAIQQTIYNAVRDLHCLLKERGSCEMIYSCFEGFLMYLKEADVDVAMGTCEQLQTIVLCHMIGCLYIEYFNVLLETDTLGYTVEAFWTTICSLGQRWELRSFTQYVSDRYIRETNDTCAFLKDFLHGEATTEHFAWHFDIEYYYKLAEHNEMFNARDYVTGLPYDITKWGRQQRVSYRMPIDVDYDVEEDDINL